MNFGGCLILVSDDTYLINKNVYQGHNNRVYTIIVCILLNTRKQRHRQFSKNHIAKEG